MVSSISVIIPTHNRIVGLKKSLNSFFRQAYLPAEIIVVDDGSHPAVTETVFDGAPDSVNCILVRNEIPRGGNFARNKGASLASGKYVAFLDDDDTWDSEKLALQLALMESEDLDLSYTGKTIITVDKNLTELSRRYSFAKPKFSDLRKSIMRQNFIGTTSSIMVKKSSFDGVEGFDEQMPALQDYELYIRLIFSANKVQGLDKPLVNYYIHKKSSAVSKSLKKNFEATSQLLRKHRKKPFYLDLVRGCLKITLKKIIKGH
jgi:glycosyltransferase involved in cell wall biosynthesis